MVNPQEGRNESGSLSRVAIIFSPLEHVANKLPLLQGINN